MNQIKVSNDHILTISTEGSDQTTYKESQLDETNSCAILGSVWADQNGNVSKIKSSDDKVVSGYHSGNMPFLIIVDGFYGGNTEETNLFIDNHVIPLINSYAKNLFSTKDPDLITKEYIKKIYDLRKKSFCLGEFTMGIIVTYKKDKYMAAGFSIGDIGFAIQSNGKLKQLLAHTEVDGFKDAFDDYSSSNIDLVIERNEIFHGEISENDEIIGYTYLPDSMEKVYTEFKTQNLKQITASPSTQEEQTVLKKHLLLNRDRDSHQVKECSLFENLKQQILVDYNAKCEHAKSCPEEESFGDDFAIGRIIAPHEELRLKIQSVFKDHKQYNTKSTCTIS